MAESANAKRYTFGDRESIGFLETTSIVNEKGEALFLGYKTTQVNFFIPLYNKDGGYILGKLSNYGRTYYPLDDQNKLKTWQQNGQLPKVLPKYHIDILSTAVIIIIIFILLSFMFPLIYNYLKNKRSEKFAKLLLTSFFLISSGYLIYETIPSGAKKQRLISTIKQWNTCVLKQDIQCIEDYIPNIIIKQFNNDYNVSFFEAMKQVEKYMMENKIKIIDKKLDETFTVKKSKFFHNVYTATGNIITTFIHGNKRNQSNEKFFSISIDDGKSWKIIGVGDKSFVDMLSSAYPFMEDLKIIGDNK
jgi:hypothetical protein